MSIKTFALRSVAALSGAAVLVALPASAETVLKLNDSGVTVSAPLTSISMSVARNPVYDPMTYEPVPNETTIGGGPFYANKALDAASIDIIKSIVSADVFPSATIEITPDAAGRGPLTVWTLDNVILNSYSTYSDYNTNSGETVESFEIAFSKATVSFYPVDKTGKRASTPSKTVSFTGNPGTAMPLDH